MTAIMRHFLHLVSSIWDAVIYLASRRLPLMNKVTYISYNGKALDPSIVFLYTHHSKFFDVENCKSRLHQIQNAGKSLFAQRLQVMRVNFDLATSRYLISNIHQSRYFSKRNGQRYIQLWHGVSIKRLGKDRIGFLADKKYNKIIKKQSEAWDYLIASSEYESQVYRSAFSSEVNTVKLGSCRVIAMREFSLTKSASVKKLSILFAPSWREGAEDTFLEFNPNKLALKLAETFPDCRIIFKPHHEMISESVKSFPKNLIIVSPVENISDLIIDADVLISDYSSIIFDSLAMDKHVLIYAPDIDRYKESPGLYIDISTEWASNFCGTDKVLFSKVNELINNDFSSQMDLRKSRDKIEVSSKIDYLNKFKDLVESMRLPKKSMKSAYSFLVLHLSLVTFGGISQLVYFHVLSQELNLQAFTHAVLVLTLPALIPFLDFGLFGLVNYYFSKQNKDSEIVKSRIFAFRIASMFSIIGILTGIYLVFIQELTIFGLFLIFSYLALPLYMVAVVLRASGRIFQSLIFTNLQWPISLAILIILINLTSPGFLVFSFLPSVLTIVILLIALFITRHFITTLFISDGSEKTYQFRPASILSEMLWITISTIPIFLLLNLDRYLASWLLPKYDLSGFVVLSSAMGAAMTLLLLPGAIRTSEIISAPANSNSKIMNIKSTSFLIAAIYLVGFTLLSNFLLYKTGEDRLILILNALFIIAFGNLTEFQAILTANRLYKFKSIMLWSHLVLWVTSCILFVPAQGVKAFSILNIFLTLLHILSIQLYLKRQANMEKLPFIGPENLQS